MKKFFALALALVLACSLAVTCFAATAGSGDVTATYAAGAAAATVHSVNVAFGDMKFTYTGASQGVWDADEHKYEGATEAAWTAVGNTVTVTNHSNVAVDVTVTYAAATGFEGVTGTITNGSFNLATAVGTAVSAAPSATATLNLSGALAEGTTNATIGTVTVAFQ